MKNMNFLMSLVALVGVTFACGWLLGYAGGIKHVPTRILCEAGSEEVYSAPHDYPVWELKCDTTAIVLLVD